MTITALQLAKSSISGFSEFYDRFLMKISIAGLSESTISNYSRHLAKISIHFETIPTLLTRDQVESYFYFIQKTYTAPSAMFFRLTVASLRFVFKSERLKDLEFCIPHIKYPVKLPVVLNKMEIIGMMNKPPLLKHRLLIALLYGCGLRCGEVRNININDIDLHRAMLHIRQGKGKKDRYVPLGNYLTTVLKQFIEIHNPVGLLFENHSMKKRLYSFDKKISTRGILWAIKEAAKKAGVIKKINVHTLRHTFATHLLEDGLDIVSIKELLGHANIQTTMVYLHVARPLFVQQKFSPIDKLPGVRIIQGFQTSLVFPENNIS